MCQVLLRRLGIRKYWDVPTPSNKRPLQYLPILPCLLARDKKSIEMGQVPLISAPDHTYQFQYVYTLGIRKYWDVPGTINKRSWSYISISTCPQTRDRKVLRCAKYD